MSASSYLVKGDDALIVDQEHRRLAHELLGDVDPAIGLEEVDLDLASIEDRAGALSWLLDAMRTPPFLVERRVVLAREVGKLTADESRGLVDALAEPTDGVITVLSSSGGRIAPGVAKAVGETINVGVGRTTADKGRWWTEHLASAPVKLDAKAGKLIKDTLGEDTGRLGSFLEVLVSTYGEGASLTASQVAPLLGTAGSIPSWDLTEPLATGNMAAALAALRRMDNAMHAHAVLRGYYLNLQAIDGSAFTSPAAVQEATGLSPYPAEKALRAARALGSDRIARAVDLVTRAEFDLKGGSNLEDLAVVEVLVARLAQLASVGARR